MKWSKRHPACRLDWCYVILSDVYYEHNVEICLLMWCSVPAHCDWKKEVRKSRLASRWSKWAWIQMKMTRHANLQNDLFPLIWWGSDAAWLLAPIPMGLFSIQLATSHHPNILLLCPFYSPRCIQLVLISKWMSGWIKRWGKWLLNIFQQDSLFNEAAVENNWLDKSWYFPLLQGPTRWVYGGTWVICLCKLEFEQIARRLESNQAWLGGFSARRCFMGLGSEVCFNSLAEVQTSNWAAVEFNTWDYLLFGWLISQMSGSLLFFRAQQTE